MCKPWCFYLVINLFVTVVGVFPSASHSFTLQMHNFGAGQGSEKSYCIFLAGPYYCCLHFKPLLGLCSLSDPWLWPLALLLHAQALFPCRTVWKLSLGRKPGEIFSCFLSLKDQSPAIFALQCLQTILLHILFSFCGCFQWECKFNTG